MTAPEQPRPGPRLLITGGSGFIGGRLLARAAPDWPIAATYWSQSCAAENVAWYPLDVRDAAATDACLRAARPEVVIHAAYRKDEPKAVIARGTEHVVAAAARVGARVLLISTDQVFDGGRGGYREEDEARPVAAYGRAKLVAERAVLAAGGLVVRTSLVYATRPPDPAHRALLVEPLARGETPTLFTDEYRSPTDVDDLADALLELAAMRPEAWAALPLGGVLHVAGPERLDRYTFSLRLAPHLGIPSERLSAGTLAASGLIRPADCSLDTGRARALLRTRLRPTSEVLGGD